MVGVFLLIKECAVEDDLLKLTGDTLIVYQSRNERDKVNKYLQGLGAIMYHNGNIFTFGDINIYPLDLDNKDQFKLCGIELSKVYITTNAFNSVQGELLAWFMTRIRPTPVNISLLSVVNVNSDFTLFDFVKLEK